MERSVERLPLVTIAREWARIGCTSFGGPAAQIALLRRLCVEDRAWLSEAEFEDAIAAVNLLPGPAAAQLAIFCAWRLRGFVGGAVGGLCLIAPGLTMILALAILFLQSNPPLWIRGAAAGSGAAVSAVAVQASCSLLPASWRRAGLAGGDRTRWCIYLIVGGVAAATAGPWLVLLLLSCGLVEVLVRARPGVDRSMAVLAAVAAPSLGGLAALGWVSFKVGALSYGGGFVIVPLMQHDAVDTYHWMTAAQFLNAVALGQVTPGPVVQTVAVVGYAAAGIGGALLAATIAFAPSFVFIFVGGPRFEELRDKLLVKAFLNGAGPAAIGGIAGASIPLALALNHPWQLAVLAGAACWLLLFRRGVVSAIIGAGIVGVAVALLGAPVGM
jgi:chromate transporter